MYKDREHYIKKLSKNLFGWGIIAVDPAKPDIIYHFCGYEKEPKTLELQDTFEKN